MLDRAAGLVPGSAPRHSRAPSALEAGKPLKQARAEAARCVYTLTLLGGRGAPPRRPGRPDEASAAGAGQARGPAAGAGWRGRRDLPLQLPPQPRRAQGGAGHRGRLPGRAEAGLHHTPLRPPARPGAARRRPPPGTLWCRAGAARSATRSSTTLTSRSSRSPEAVRWAGRSGGASRERRSPSSSGTPPRSSSPPTPTWTWPRRKLAASGYTHAGQSCISVQRVYVHPARSHDAFLECFVPQSGVTGYRLDEATDVGPVIDAEARERIVDWLAQAGSRRRRGGDGRGCPRRWPHSRPAVVTGDPPRT